MGENMTTENVSFADPNVQKCPFAAYHSVRSEGPVYIDPNSGFYVVTDYALVRKVAADTATFSSLTGLLLYKDDNKETLDAIWREKGVLPVPVLVISDPPDHTFYRSLVDKAFTPLRVRQMEDYLESIVEGMIDEIAGKGEAEFLGDFASQIPLRVIADQLGMPRDDLPLFKLWSDTVIAQGQHNNSVEEQVRITHILCDLQQYTLKKAAEYRAKPQECMLSDMANADVDGRKLNDQELTSVIFQVLTAGYETTAAAMTAGILRIIRTPGLEDSLREDPERIPNFIEEVLRLDAPVQGLFRRATRDSDIGGFPVPAGATVQLMWGGANRDPGQFADPDAFNPTRDNARRHVTFGFGPHICIGNQLARGELRIAFTRLLQRLKSFRLVDEPDYIAHAFAYGVKALHIAFDGGE
jgi:cytochrome P450